MKSQANVYVPVSIYNRYVIISSQSILFPLQSFIIPSAALAKIISTLRRKKEFKNRYKTVEVELANSHDWPPVNEVTMATHESGLGSILQSLSLN